MRCLLFVGLTACASSKVRDHTSNLDAGLPLDDSGETDAGLEPDAAAATDCSDITDTTPATLTATDAGETVLTLEAKSASSTSWDQAGNEAVVLEVSGAQGLIGHLVLHEGDAITPYAMHLGALAASDAITIRVSKLTAVNATLGATVCTATLKLASSLTNAEGILHAPIYRWPVQKRFDDVPLVTGWSKARKSYQAVMTNENGGTAEICGGGASGMQAEIARWGRSTDIEGHYGYGGASPTWDRCTGRIDIATTPILMEQTHPILYYGDGHNRLFENRGGYGQACGTNSPERPTASIDGWNTNNPGNDLANDAGRVVILRPVPVDLDGLGFASYLGRREAIADKRIPWIYRIASEELAREGKIDNNKTLAMSRYLYADVRVSDVGGSGDSYCTSSVTGGFVLRVVTGNGTTISSGEITGDYAGSGGHDWKRVAIKLPSGVAAADIDHFVFDAYDGDGIYLTAIGDVFIPIDDGNGSKMDYVRTGTKALTYYVDDDKSGCTNGTNNQGPGGVAYTCTGTIVTIPK